MSTTPPIRDDDDRKDAVQRAAQLMNRTSDRDADLEIAAITEAIAEYDMRRGSGTHLTLGAESISAKSKNS